MTLPLELLWRCSQIRLNLHGSFKESFSFAFLVLKFFLKESLQVEECGRLWCLPRHSRHWESLDH